MLEAAQNLSQHFSRILAIGAVDRTSALLSFPLYLLHIFSPFLPALQARLVIVAGPAMFLLLFFSSPPSFLAPRPDLSLWQVSPSSSPLTYRLGPSLALSHSFLPLTSSLLPPRARRPPWEIQSDLADARQDRSTSDLLAFLHFEKYQLLQIVWLCLTFRYHVTLMDYVAWRCLASVSFLVVVVRLLHL